MEEATRVHLALADEEPNLYLQTADGNASFAHAVIDVASLVEAAERALDQVRAEHGGELPASNVTVERPPDDAEGKRTGNGSQDG